MRGVWSYRKGASMNSAIADGIKRRKKEALAWLQADSGRLDRWNALRERAGVGAITVEQAALFMGAGDEEAVRLIKERVG